MKWVKSLIKVFLLASLLLCLSASSSYADRLPKNKTAERVINHYFHKYGRKFKDSDFGKHKIKEISVYDIQEIHKNMVAATADVLLFEGPVYHVRCVLEKKSLSWQMVLWEKI